MEKPEIVCPVVIAASLIYTVGALSPGEHKHTWETKLRWQNPRMENLPFSF